MAGEIEAAGGLATAALAAHALDAEQGRTGQAHGRCANCDTALTGAFCHACGQSAQVHRSLGHALEEFLHGVWHFDSKAWRTLPLLAFRPGKLTHDYIHGHRARYIAPLALFLLSIFLMFFVFGFVGAPKFGGGVDAAGRAEQVATTSEAVDDMKREVAANEAGLAKARAAGDRAAIAAAEQDLAASRIGLRVAAAAMRRGAADTGGKAAPSWQEEVAEAARSGELKINSGSASIDANIRKTLLNPDFAIYKVQQKAYKLSFLLVPMSLPVLWLMFFWRRDVTIYDHTVFALYSLSFMSLLLVLAVLLLEGAAAIGGGLSGAVLGSTGLLMLIPPVHMYFQLKGTYRLSAVGALVRTAFLSIGTMVTLSLFFTLIVIIGLAD